MDIVDTPYFQYLKEAAPQLTVGAGQDPNIGGGHLGPAKAIYQGVVRNMQRRGIDPRDVDLRFAGWYADSENRLHSVVPHIDRSSGHIDFKLVPFSEVAPRDLRFSTDVLATSGFSGGTFDYARGWLRDDVKRQHRIEADAASTLFAVPDPKHEPVHGFHEQFEPVYHEGDVVGYRRRNHREWRLDPARHWAGGRSESDVAWVREPKDLRPGPFPLHEHVPSIVYYPAGIFGHGREQAGLALEEFFGTTDTALQSAENFLKRFMSKSDPSKVDMGMIEKFVDPKDVRELLSLPGYQHFMWWLHPQSQAAEGLRPLANKEKYQRFVDMIGRMHEYNRQAPPHERIRPIFITGSTRGDYTFSRALELANYVNGVLKKPVPIIVHLGEHGAKIEKAYSKAGLGKKLEEAYPNVLTIEGAIPNKVYTAIRASPGFIEYGSTGASAAAETRLFGTDAVFTATPAIYRALEHEKLHECLGKLGPSEREDLKRFINTHSAVHLDDWNHYTIQAAMSGKIHGHTAKPPADLLAHISSILPPSAERMTANILRAKRHLKLQRAARDAVAEHLLNIATHRA